MPVCRRTRFSFPPYPAVRGHRSQKTEMSMGLVGNLWTDLAASNPGGNTGKEHKINRRSPYLKGSWKWGAEEEIWFSSWRELPRAPEQATAPRKQSYERWKRALLNRHHCSFLVFLSQTMWLFPSLPTSPPPLPTALPTAAVKMSTAI